MLNSRELQGVLYAASAMLQAAELREHGAGLAAKHCERLAVDRLLQLVATASATTAAEARDMLQGQASAAVAHLVGVTV